MEDTLNDLRKTNDSLRARLAALQAESSDQDPGRSSATSPTTSTFPGQPGSHGAGPSSVNPNVYSVQNRLGLDWKYISKLRAEMINSRLALVDKCERVRELQRALDRRRGRPGPSGGSEPGEGEWEQPDGLQRRDSQSRDAGAADVRPSDTPLGTPMADAPPKDEPASQDPSLMSLNDRDLLSETRVRLLTTDIDRKIAAAQEKALDLALRKLDEDRTELGQFRELLIGEMLARGLIGAADEVEEEGTMAVPVQRM